MDQAIPLRKISLQNETGLSEDVLNEQAPDAFMIAWRRALPVEQRVGMRGLILDIALTAIERASESLSHIPDMEIKLTYLEDDFAITDRAVVDALTAWKEQVKPYINQHDIDDLINAICLYRHEIDGD